MLMLILHWLLSSVILMLLAQILPGLVISNFGTALIAIFVLSLVNFLVRPLVSLLTLPITFLTLGLFSFVINAAMFGLAAWMVPGFEIHGFWNALLASLLLALLTGVLDSMLKGPGRPHAV